MFDMSYAIHLAEDNSGKGANFVPPRTSAALF